MRRIFAIVATASISVAAWGSAASAEDERRKYKIEMYNAFGIVDGSEVRVAGVNVGEVTDLTVNEEKRALVTVEIAGELAVLGEETECRSEPQSLIAEYFIDCEPAGAPLDDGGTVPASQVSQTVQPDLVQNTLREPYRDRLRLLISEFGTGLAGNAESLNEAIRLGAPALTAFQDATETLASQRVLIRELTSDSEVILGELARQRNAIVDFVDEAEDTARVSLERREELSTNFALLDDFLAEFEPTLVELNRFAVEQTPLLENLRAAAPGLNRLALNLPPFNRATDVSLDSLGDASQVGERAFRNGADEIRLLAENSKRAPATTEILADFLRDLDDPRRAVEIDDRVGPETGRTSTTPGARDTMGYTGLEGLLNYIRNQSLTINQFDKVSHLFRFGVYEAFTGSCGTFSSGRDTQTGEPGVPSKTGGTTTSVLEADDCVSWLGDSQPGINEDLGLPKYDPDVCPNGTAPEAARIELCDPNDAARASQVEPREDRDRSRAADREPALDVPGLPGGGTDPPDAGGILEDLPGSMGLGGRRDRDERGAATDDLLDFLFAP